MIEKSYIITGGEEARTILLLRDFIHFSSTKLTNVSFSVSISSLPPIPQSEILFDVRIEI